MITGQASPPNDCMAGATEGRRPGINEVLNETISLLNEANSRLEGIISKTTGETAPPVNTSNVDASLPEGTINTCQVLSENLQTHVRELHDSITNLERITDMV